MNNWKYISNGLLLIRPNETSILGKTLNYMIQSYKYNTNYQGVMENKLATKPHIQELQRIHYINNLLVCYTKTRV